MKVNNIIPIALLGTMLFTSHANASNLLNFFENKLLPGTYALEFTQSCTQGVPPADFAIETVSVGKFTLDGNGNFTSIGDDVWLGDNGFMGQANEHCTGEYFVEAIDGVPVVRIPAMQCIGQLTFGSEGAVPEPEPRSFFNFEVVVKDTSLLFQRYQRNGIYSDLPSLDTPVDVEQFNIVDFPQFSSDRRCRRNGSFHRIGSFKALISQE